MQNAQCQPCCTCVWLQTHPPTHSRRPRRRRSKKSAAAPCPPPRAHTPRPSVSLGALSHAQMQSNLLSAPTLRKVERPRAATELWGESKSQAGGQECRRTAKRGRAFFEVSTPKLLFRCSGALPSAWKTLDLFEKACLLARDLSCLRQESRAGDCCPHSTPPRHLDAHTNRAAGVFKEPPRPTQRRSTHSTRPSPPRNEIHFATTQASDARLAHDEAAPRRLQ